MQYSSRHSCNTAHYRSIWSIVSVWPQWWQVVGVPRDKIWDLVALVWPIRRRVITTSSALVKCWNFFACPSVGECKVWLKFYLCNCCAAHTIELSMTAIYRVYSTLYLLTHLPLDKWPPIRRLCFQIRYRELGVCSLIKKKMLMFVPKVPIDNDLALV